MMIKFIKENWLIALISGAIGSLITWLIICVFNFEIWSGNLTATWIGAIGSILGGGGTVVLAIFAWKAYKYATSSYEKQAEINETVKVMVKHYIKIISEINLALSTAEIELSQLKAFYSSTASRVYNTMDEIKENVIQHNTKSRILSKQLMNIMVKLSELRKEVMIYSNVFQLNKEATNGIYELIKCVAENLYKIIISNQEHKDKVLLIRSKNIHTESEIINELVVFFKDRNDFLEKELNKLELLVKEIVNKIPQLKEVWIK